jgi:SAM-dependent methyltransferase
VLRSWLAHPLTRGLDLDSPQTTVLRRRIVREKRFLRRLYEEWYRRIAASIPEGDGAVVELGAGAGFFGELLPGLVATDIQAVEGIDAAADATELPFASGCLRAVVMTNLLHHVRDPRRCLAEAARCVRPGGVLSAIEPWVSTWSGFVYSRLHHEPFDPTAMDWNLPSGGPLSGANGALPWILFARDRERFEAELPQWRLERLHPLMPFRYLVSGGVSMRQLAPGWSFGAWTLLERALEPAMGTLAMFAHVVLRRTGAAQRSRAAAAQRSSGESSLTGGGLE